MFTPGPVILVYTFIGGGLVFAMFGVHSGATVIVFALLYGPCNAACAFLDPYLHGGSSEYALGQSMFPTAIASFMRTVHEFG